MRAWLLLRPTDAKWILTLACLFCIQCSERLAGGSTEIGNTGQIAGNILTLDGTLAANVRVRLIPASFDPQSGLTLPANWITHTNRDGKFQFKSVDSGMYNIEASDTVKGTLALIVDVWVRPGTDTIIAGKDAKLAEAGSVSLPMLGLPKNGYFYIPGTFVSSRLDSLSLSKSELYLEHVPAGKFSKLVQCFNQTEIKNLLGRPMTVTPGEVLFLGPYYAWHERHSIGITGIVPPKIPLIDFPFLVRLDATNFDFKSSQANGSDIRFSKMDGVSPLSFEIERWDNIQEKAEIWVNVDTLFTQFVTQPFFIFTGNRDVTTTGNGEAVFDTAQGYSGVWHLGDGLQDATAYGNQGSNHGTTTVAGAIGSARSFDGSGVHISAVDAPSLRFGTGDFTFSVWVSLDSFNVTRQIFAKRDTAENYEIQVSKDAQVTAMLDPKGNKTLYLFSNTILQKGSWYLIAFVRSKGRAYLYINGVLDAIPLELPTSANPSSELRIGDDPIFSKLEGFLGKIDELEFSNIAKTPEWMDYMYQSQKPDAGRISLLP
jgi:hypothetical protein